VDISMNGRRKSDLRKENHHNEVVSTLHHNDDRNLNNMQNKSNNNLESRLSEDMKNKTCKAEIDLERNEKDSGNNKKDHSQLTPNKPTKKENVQKEKIKL